MLDSPWLIAGFAFILGLLAGWMLWGRSWRNGFASRNGDASDEAAAELAGRNLFNEDAGVDGNLATVIAELNKAKAALEEADQAGAEMSEEIEKLDQAVKRANGRLKLVLKSVDRAADES